MSWALVACSEFYISDPFPHGETSFPLVKRLGLSVFCSEFYISDPFPHGETSFPLVKRWAFLFSVGARSSFFLFLWRLGSEVS